MLSKQIKQKLARGEKVLGSFMTFDFWPGYLEIMQKNDLDFVVVDTEHGFPGTGRLEELCRIGRLIDFPVLVRPAWCDYIQIKRTIDIGAHGLMIPWIESKEQLLEIERSIYSPPRGIHGMGGPSIKAVDGVSKKDWQLFEENLLVTCQIETPKGMAMAQEIASSEFIDAIFVGPYDLAHSLDLLDDYFGPEHIAAIMAILKDCHKHNKPVGMVVGDGVDAKRFFELGFDLIIMGECTSMYTRGLKLSMAELKAT